MRYQKTIVVEAFQMTRRHYRDTGTWPEWLRDAYAKQSTQIGAMKPRNGIEGEPFVIQKRLEGRGLVNVDDWIVQGADGELSLYVPDVFEKTHTAVEGT